MEASGAGSGDPGRQGHAHASAAGFIGSRVERAEDDELLMGKGVFVDDIEFPGMLHAYVVRSPHAHAKLLRIDTRQAKALAGVVDIVTFGDMGDVRRFPLTIPHPNLKTLTEYPLANDKVRYVGEPVAVIVAASRQIAEDAAPLVEVEYETLPPCVDIESAPAQNAPLVHDGEKDNVAGFMKQKAGDVDKEFAEADHLVKEELRIHRGGCHAIETRGIVAHYV